jgi:chromosome segregation ATPase
MAHFFQQLVALGEEQPTSTVSAGNIDDLEGQSKEQLLQTAKRLSADLQQRRDEYEALRSESTQLRSEYDAYKLKIESWQLKMRETRDEDRKLIAQLRQASGGNTDELIVKSMNDTIAKYKEELRKAHEDVAREHKRRQDTEDARARFEEAKKQEMDAMLARLEKTRDQTKRSQQLLEEKLATAQQRAAKLEKSLAEANTRTRELTAKLADTQAQTPDRAQSAPDAEDAASPIPTAAAASDTSDSELRRANSVTRDALEQQQAEHRRALEAAEAEKAALQDQLERCQKQLDDAQEEIVEAAKKLAEVRATADANATKLTAAEAEREKMVSGLQLEERKLQRQIRNLEEEMTAVKASRVEEERALNATIEALRAENAALQMKAKARDDAMGEVEQNSARAAEVINSERRTLLQQITALESRIHAADMVKRGVEETIEDLRADLRRRDEAYDELRRELEDQVMRGAELEAQLTVHHATVSRREDDVVSREREKQMLKHQLGAEKDQHERLKKQFHDAEDRLAEEREKHSATMQRLREVEGDRMRLQAEVRAELQKVSDGAVATEAAQRMIRDLQHQLSEQGSRTADVVKVREDQSAKVRVLEAKLRDADARVQAMHESRAEQGGSASIATGFSARPHPSAVLQSAFQHGPRITWTQSKYVIGFCLFVVLATGLFNSVGNAPTGRTPGGDTDSLLILKEKYAQALQAQLTCREQLKNSCPCSPPVVAQQSAPQS